MEVCLLPTSEVNKQLHLGLNSVCVTARKEGSVSPTQNFSNGFLEAVMEKLAVLAVPTSGAAIL